MHEERSDIFLAIPLVNSFRTVGGWFECLCIYTCKLSGFVNQMSIVRFVLLVMLRPRFLNILTFFLNLSVSGPEKSLSTPNPSSWYNP